jgi:D-beta-D-heptose 7-phosphate kinase/D-beta-D-heptose 1-phosphate adenosyltransferase
MNLSNFGNLSNCNLLVIGDVMLDHYIYGECNRISPEAPVPVFEIIKEQRMLGGAGNVVKNILSLGAKCDFITVIGDDQEGEDVTLLLRQQGLNADNILKEDNRRSTLKKRLIASSQQLIRIDKESRFNIDRGTEKKIYDIVEKNISNYDIVLLSDYLKGVLTYELCRSIIDLCYSTGVKLIIDPKGSDYSKYKNAYLLKPNLKELEAATNQKIENIEDLKSAAHSLKEDLNIQSLVVTMGDKGIFFSDKMDKVCPTISNNVFDVSGAGDTVFACVGVCLAHGFSIEMACRFANSAASIVIRKFGSETTTIEEIIQNSKLYEKYFN